MYFFLCIANSSESAYTASDTDGSDGSSSEEDSFLKTELPKIIRETISEEELDNTSTSFCEKNEKQKVADGSVTTDEEVADNAAVTADTDVTDGVVTTNIDVADGAVTADTAVPISKHCSDNLKKSQKKPSRPCCFCGIFQTRLTRHMKTVHKKEKKVVEIMKLPIYEQNLAFANLRKEGIFNYNVKLLNAGEEQDTLLCERKQVSKSDEKKKRLKICPNCKGFIRSRYYFKHKINCALSSSKDGNNDLSISPGIVPDLLRVHKNVNDAEFADILNRFRPDEIGKLCQKNEFIITFGKYLFKKNNKRKGKVVETRRDTMQNMRTLASLFLGFKDAALNHGAGNKKIEEMFQRDNFKILEEAIENMSQDDATNEVKCGTKLLIGNVIKRVIKVYKGTLLIQKQDIEAAELDKFFVVLTIHWNSLFGAAEGEALIKRQEKLRKPNELPMENDVTKIKKHIEAEVQNLSRNLCKEESLLIHRYIRLRNLAVARVTFFNARRGGEPSRALLSDWKDARTDKWIDQERLINCTDEEKKLLTLNKIIYLGGKRNGSLVPIIIINELVHVLDLLADSEIRIKAGINPSNKFLFPSTRGSLDHVQGNDCIQKVATEAGASKNITATKMRHRAATMFANLEMPEKDREFFYSHMGHSSEVNENVYQCPPAVRELQQVGSFLTQIDDSERNHRENIITTAEKDTPQNESIQEMARNNIDQRLSSSRTDPGNENKASGCREMGREIIETDKTTGN